MRGWRVLQKKNLTPLYDTRAALLRTYQNPVDEKPLWQMPRFTKSVSSFLSVDEKPLWLMPRFTKSVSSFLSADENSSGEVYVCSPLVLTMADVCVY